MVSNNKQKRIKVRVKEAIEQILPPSNIELEDIKEEIWKDLSSLYYKYEDEDQKRAFRFVMQEICEKISQGKWDSVYRKLYRSEQKERPF
jgi:hypothetical protein